MVSTNSVRNVLRMIWAGKEEAPAAPTTPASPVTPTETEDEPKSEDMAVKRYRYYYFDAPATKSIPFKSLKQILGSNDNAAKTSLIEKLKGGNTSKYSADYFRWLKLAVVTNQYSPGGKGNLVYETDLNPMGTKIAGKETITPDNLGVTVDTVEKDLTLFSNKMNNPDAINIDTSSEARFINVADKGGKPPSNLTQLLLSGAVPPGQPSSYEQFKSLFDEFRVWSITTNQLVLPSLDMPTQDNGLYTGGEAAYKALVGPVEQQLEQAQVKTPLQPSLGDKMEQEKDEGGDVFEPVDERTKAQNAPVQGDVVSTPAGGGRKMFAQDINSVRRVMVGYLKDAAAGYAPVTPQTQSQTQGQGAEGPVTQIMTGNLPKDKRTFDEIQRNFQKARDVGKKPS